MTRQLQLAEMVTPGALGLNLKDSGAITPAAFATEATNAVIDDAGRLTLRNGYEVKTSTPISGTPAIKELFEYRTATGATEVIVAWDGGVANDIVDPEGNTINGTVTATSGQWHFSNFNSKLIATQSGQKLGVYTAVSGTLDTVVEASGTAPSGGISHAAFGRIWQLDSDGVTIKYCGLLDETDWGGVGSGSLDMSAVWTNGTDQVTAIHSFNNAIVVFGKRHIVFWADPTGTELGIDPTQMVVGDVIEGTGCIAQSTVTAIGETDLVFLAPTGVQSLRRLVIEKSRPTVNLSKYVQNTLVAEATAQANASSEAISSIYDSNTGMYLISLPSQGSSWYMNQFRRFADQKGDEAAPCTYWDLAPTAMLRRDNGDILFGGIWGVAQYSKYQDDDAVLTYKYMSPWMDFGEEASRFLKVLKRISALVSSGGAVTVTFKWGKDFSTDLDSLTVTTTAGDPALFGVALFGEDIYGTQTTLESLQVPARGTFQYLRIGVEVTASSAFSTQQITPYAKIGRLN